jgi:hypothetical protein
MDDSQEVFFKTSEVQHSSMTEGSTLLDQNISAGAGEGAPCDPLRDVPVPNISKIITSELKGFQCELLDQFKSMCDNHNEQMNKVQSKISNEFYMVQHDLHEKIADMTRRVNEIQQMVESNTKSQTSTHYPEFSSPSVPISQNISTSPTLSHSHIPQNATSYHSHQFTKPNCFDGTEDFDEYLAQFEMLTKLNRWDYHTKSLHLACSLKGDALSILSELSESEREDYQCLVRVLKTRFGFQGKAELSRAQLQTKIKRENETMSELAHTIKKLTRNAYPDAPSSVLKVLARDYFIDAIPNSDLRLKVREAIPQNIDEAETIAIRLEAHRQADRQRSNKQSIRAVQAPSTETQISENKEISDLLKTGFKDVINTLTKEIRKLGNSQKQPHKNYDNQKGTRYDKNPNHKYNQSTNRNPPNQTNTQPQATLMPPGPVPNMFPAQFPPNHFESRLGPYHQPIQGNELKSSPGVSGRHSQNGPRQ